MDLKGYYFKDYYIFIQNITKKVEKYRKIIKYMCKVNDNSYIKIKVKNIFFRYI